MEKQQQGQRKEYKKKNSTLSFNSFTIVFPNQIFPFLSSCIFTVLALCVAIISSFFAIYNISFFFFFFFFFFLYGHGHGCGRANNAPTCASKQTKYFKRKKKQIHQYSKTAANISEEKRDCISFQLN
jgi:hypothetical protein